MSATDAIEGQEERAIEIATAAIIIMAIPLGSALLLCLLWWVSRIPAFAVAGLIELLAGLIILWISGEMKRRAGRMIQGPTPAPLATRLQWVTRLRIASIPLAIACLIFGFWVNGTVFVIRNDSGQDLTELQLIDPTYDSPNATREVLRPGESWRIDQRQRDDASTELHFTLEGRRVDYDVSSPFYPSRIELSIRPGGSVQ